MKSAKKIYDCLQPDKFFNAFYTSFYQLSMSGRKLSDNKQYLKTKPLSN